MLVSHSYKFIFIKTRKSVNTSVNLALAQFMTPDNIVTASNREQEQLKKKRGHQGAANIWKPYSQFGGRDWWEFVKDGYNHCAGGYRSLGASYYTCWPHMDANAVRAHIGEDIWNSYYKFAVERDPWDKTLSLYFFRKWQGAKRLKQGTIEQIDGVVKDEFLGWLRELESIPRYFSDAWYYCEDGGSGAFMLDHLIPYEKLQEGLSETAKKLGLPSMPDVSREKVNAHGSIRKKGIGMELFTPEAQVIMSKIFAREFEILNIPPTLS